MVGRRAKIASMVAVLTTMLASSVQAQVDIEAVVDRHVVELGQVINLTIEVRSRGEGEIEVARFESPDFEVTSSIDLNNTINRVSHFSRRLGLVARREGDLTINPIAIAVGRHRYHTDPISVRVRSTPGAPTAQPRARQTSPPRLPDPPARSSTRAPTGPERLAPPRDQPEPNLPERVLSRQPFLAASPTSREVYAGEQFVVDYEMFAPSRGWRLVSLDQPAFPHFWFTTVELERTQYERRIVGEHQHYSSSLTARFVLAALEQGTVSIPTLSAEASRRGQRIELASPTFPIEVRALPSGAPDGFYGSNVGQYEFTVDVNASRRRVGDPIRVVMRVEGCGLTSLLRLPELPVSGQAQLQPPVEQRAQDLITEYHVGGYKQVEVIVIPTEEGDLTIGPISFHHFDPEEGTYHTTTSESWLFVISGVSPSADLVLAADSGQEYQSRLLDALPEPRDSTSEVPVISIPTPLFWGLLAFPPLAYLLLGLSGRVKRRRAVTAPMRAKRSALGTARRAIRGAPKSDDPHGMIAASMRHYLRDRLGIAATALTLGETRSALQRNGAIDEVADEICRVLEECENAKFGNLLGGDDASDLSDRALDALDAVERLR